MNVNLERIVAEDETAERKRLQEERDARRRMLSARVDAAVARILADAEHDVAVRRARRERRLQEPAQRGDPLLDRAAETFVDILRDRPRKKTL